KRKGETGYIFGLSRKSYFHRGGFRTRLAGRQLLTKFFAGQTRRLGFDPPPHQLFVLGLRPDRPLVTPPFGHDPDLPCLAFGTAADGDALIIECGRGNAPSFSYIADTVAVTHSDVGEEYFVEFGLTGDLPQGLDVDTRVGHIDNEI